MTITSTYVGISQPDIASVDYAGLTYVASVWIDHGDNTVVAKIFSVGEGGQRVLLESSVVRLVTEEDISPDCPRVLGLSHVGAPASVSPSFVVHWIENDEQGLDYLHRATFALDDVPSGWSYEGSVEIYRTSQYDACEISDDDTEFVVVYRNALAQITTLRGQEPYGWGDTAWSVTTLVTIADTVLSCSARDSDDAVIINYQSVLTLLTLRLNASDGLGPATVECFGDVLDGDNHFTAVAAVGLSGSEFMVLAEVANDADQTAGGIRDYARLIAYRRVASSTALALHASQWLYNCHMASRPWTWSSGVTAQEEVYVASSFKSISDGQEFLQSYGYVLALGNNEIPGAAAGTVYPIPVGAMMDGSFDGRPHGSSPAVTDLSLGARMNHLSAVVGPPLYTLGPEGKSVTFAHLHYTRVLPVFDFAAAVRAEVVPASFKISWLTFHHEPQWTIRRDPKEATQPDTPAWRGIPRASCLPVELPEILTYSGGVTQVYDGESLVELGFMWSPEITAVTDTEPGGSINDLGDYWFTATYAWADSKGHLHRSPPAVPILGNVGAVATSFSVDVRNMNLSMKDDLARYPNAGPITIELWRTYQVSGADATNPTTGNFLFRRVYGRTTGSSFRLRDTPESDKAGFQQAISDDVTNNAIVYNELLPWQLNTSTLQFTPPPPIPHVALRVIERWQDRMFGYDALAGIIRWSEQILPLGTQFLAPEFLDTNTFRLDGVGEVVGMAAMDNGLFLLTKSSVYVMRGNPGAGGVGANLDLDIVPGAPGCMGPQSVVVTPAGIFYQSPKGMYGIGRETGIAYIGGPVETIVRDAGNLRSAVVLEDRHQVRWTFQALPTTGPLGVRPQILIYDYRLKMWCTAVLPMLAQTTATSRLNEMQSATVWPGRQGASQYVVMAQGAVAIERTEYDTVFADTGASGTVAIPLDITTEWIKVLLGLTKRVYEIEIVMERINLSPITIEAWFDVDGTWDSDDGAAEQTLVVAAPESTIRFRPRIQKCRGIKLRVYESDTVAQTENVRLVALVLHFGVKSRQQGRRNQV